MNARLVSVVGCAAGRPVAISAQQSQCADQSEGQANDGLLCAAENPLTRRCQPRAAQARLGTLERHLMATANAVLSDYTKLKPSPRKRDPWEMSSTDGRGCARASRRRGGKELKQPRATQRSQAVQRKCSCRSLARTAKRLWQEARPTAAEVGIASKMAREIAKRWLLLFQDARDLSLLGHPGGPFGKTR